eukprot:symbB.v1.2.030951.t1/scaffold3543.1/size54354/2
MNKVAVKLICGGVLFLVAMLGAVLSKYASSFSPKIVRVCNAFPGGILLAVTLVHMLADSSEDLETPGVAVAAFFTGDKNHEAFPLAFSIVGLGFLTILSVEVFLPGGHDGEHSGIEGDSDSETESETPDLEAAKAPVLPKSCAAGLSALLGLCLHSLNEGTATGAAQDVSEFSNLFIAIIAHKMFAVFSAGTLILNSVSVRAWWTLMTILCAMTPVGIAIGMIVQSRVHGAWAAGIDCFAAGTLLCVAVYDMLMPSLVIGKGEWKRRSFIAALFGFCSMSLLAIWS